jgi:hypothetical protein
MHICISRCAAATRHASRGQISRKRETTKTRKPETKCRRLPEPEPSLMHSLYDSIRRGRGYGRSGTVPGTAPCAAVRAAASSARQAGPPRLFGFGERQGARPSDEAGVTVSL